MEHIKGKVVLASGSPRRLEIMKQELGFTNIQAVPSNFPENLSQEDYAPFEYPIATATQKALAVYKREVNDKMSPELVVAADTVVELDGFIVEKPRDIEHHVNTLKQLRDSERPHRVYTGVVAIIPYEKPVLPGYALDSALGVSEVTFRKDITDEEIIKYVASKERADAAGGYKIQGAGGNFVKTVNGDKFNVIGLPIEETKKLIDKVWAESQEENDEFDEDEYQDGEGGAQYF